MYPLNKRRQDIDCRQHQTDSAAMTWLSVVGLAMLTYGQVMQYNIDIEFQAASIHEQTAQV